MIRLTRLLGMLVGWAGRSRRRQLAVLAVPVLAAIALFAPHGTGRGQDRGGLLASPATAGRASVAAGSPTAAPTELPGTSAPVPGPSAAARAVPPLAAGQRQVAASYVETVNSHDARPGRDRSFLDSYRRARSYVTPELYQLISAESRRGDYQWDQWTRQQATVAVEIVRVAVPDGAPAPGPSAAFVRVQFRQVVTPHAGGARTVTDSAVSLRLVTVGGRWLVSDLLPDT